MVHLTLLIASMASIALGGVTNVCAHESFRQMQHFRDLREAMDCCATHYPVQTFTKILPDRCLTSTKTVILGTSTIPAIKYLPCATNAMELRVRGADIELQRKEEKREEPNGIPQVQVTPLAVLKRDAAVSKAAEWSSYYSALAQCGYNCIQTACSCVASPKIELVCNSGATL